MNFLKMTIVACALALASQASAEVLYLNEASIPQLESKLGLSNRDATLVRASFHGGTKIGDWLRAPQGQGVYHSEDTAFNDDIAYGNSHGGLSDGVARQLRDDVNVEMYRDRDEYPFRHSWGY